MKIAIPVDSNNLNSDVSVSFGRAPYFLIYNTESEESKFLDNSALASSGGAGIKAAQILVDHKVGALLTPRCGENADVLKAADIKLYQTIHTSVKDNIDDFKAETLPLLEEIHAGHHGRG